MKWRPWPLPMLTKKYEVKVVVGKLEGWCSSYDQMREGLGENHLVEDHELKKLMVEIRWKGPPNNNKVPLMRRRSVKRDLTKEYKREDNQNGDVFEWNDEFHNVCCFSSCKDNCYSFLPWEIDFSLLDVSLFNLCFFFMGFIGKIW